MEIDFEKGDGLVPAIIQDVTNGNVLMMGYMNQDAIDQTIATGKVTFYSRSKQRLWTKGESSGNFMIYDHMKVDCDKDTLLVKAKPTGPVCHTGSATCFGDEKFENHSFLTLLESIITDRKENDSDKSYTTSLFRKGINKIAQKVGEEAVELVIEAKDNDDDLFTNEAADLLFHYLILLQAKGFKLKDILSVLEARHKK